MNFTEKTEHWLNVIFPDKVELPGTAGVIVPSGSTGQRPSPPDPGTIRYNTTTLSLEVFTPSNSWEAVAGGGFSSIRTASNVGAGQGVFKQKVGFDLEFKSLLGSANINITDIGDELLITTAGSVGESNTASNIGSGIGVFGSKVSLDLQFKSLKSLSPTLSIANNITTVDLDLIGAPFLSLSGGTLTGSVTLDPGATIHGSSAQTASTPAFNFTADFNSGMFAPAVNTVGFATNSTEKLRIAANGAMSVPGGYESFVTTDNIIPNKKYVDDAIVALASVNVYRQIFTQANLISGVVQFAHNLNQDFVQVTIYDNFNKVIIPAGITRVSNNIIDVDLKGYGILVGNWNVVVVG